MMRAALVSACVFTLVLACASIPPGFTVEQFTVSGVSDDEKWELEIRDRVLSYSGNPIEAIGCVITPPDDQDYEFTAVHYLPGVPLAIGDGWAEPYSPSDAPNGLHSLPEFLIGERRFTWDISPGDPNGIYRIEIHINGKRVQTLEFEVRDVPPAA
jgi:hypothetical protein